MKTNCVIIDDEALARKGLSNFIREIPSLNLCGEFAHPSAALSLLGEGQVDLLFLDIQMPKMNGLDFLKSLADPPVTIITTAFHHHALEGYSLNVMDYLVKPIPFERFVKAVNKATDYLSLKKAGGAGRGGAEDYFFIKCESRYEKIAYADVLFAEAMQNYVLIHTTRRKYISYLTFKSVEENLPGQLFLKVHKSFIVSFSKIDSVESNEIRIGEHAIPVSRSNREEILNSILQNKLIRR